MTKIICYYRLLFFLHPCIGVSEKYKFFAAKFFILFIYHNSM